MVARYRTVGVSTFAWVCIEEIKRFNLALFRVCGRLTMQRDGNEDGGGVEVGDGFLFSADELQFPLPTRCSLWKAVTRDEWESSGDGLLVDLNDLAEDSWISNCAGLLNFLCDI